MISPEPGRRRTSLPVQTQRVLLLAAGLPVVLVVGAAVWFLLALAGGTIGLSLAPAVSSTATPTGPAAGTGAAAAGPTASPVPLPGSRAETIHPGVVLESGQPDTSPRAAVVSGRLYVTTWGSSVCPAVAVAVRVENPRRVAVDLLPAGGPTCTADLAPRTVSVALDASRVDLSAPLTVRLTGPGILTSTSGVVQTDVVATPMA